MQCNIDKRGRALRTTMGSITSFIGLGLLATAYLAGLPGWTLGAGWPFWTGVVCVLSGGFMIFEGLNGWCAVRAMGFKTPI